MYEVIDFSPDILRVGLKIELELVRSACGMHQLGSMSYLEFIG